MLTNKDLKKVMLFLTALIVTACGGGGDGGSAGGGGGDGVTISARVGNTYTIAYAPTFMDHVQDALLGKRAMAINSGTTVNQVVAIPSFQGHYGPADLENMQIANIGRDGSFSFTLAKSYDWVFLLVNGNETNVIDKVAGYVVASIDDNNTLVAFSGSDLATNLDLGTLVNSGNEAKSSASGEQAAASFNLTLDDLKTIAKSDDGYKYLMNLYLNYDPVSKEAYTAQLQYGWHGGTIISAGNSDPLATAISNYQFAGFDITIETAVMNESLKDGICGTTTTAELIPPGTLSSPDNSITWTNTSGFKNDGSGPNNTDLGFNNMGAANTSHWLQNGRYYCYDDDFSAQITSDFSNSLIGFGASLNIQIPATGMPEGLWVYNVDGTDVAWFDLAVASPVSAPGVFDTTPVPGIRINHNGGQITGLVVKWFQYDTASSQYVLLTDTQAAAMDSLVRDTFVDVMDEDGPDLNNPETIHLYSTEATESASSGLIDGSSIAFPTGAGAWYMPNSIADVAGNLVPTHIRIGLHMGGSLYNFSWK